MFTGKYSDITDSALDEGVQKIQGQHPGVGIRMLKGHLKSQGLTLQRERIRQSLLRTDPTGVLQRWRDSICRRVYSVPFPQAQSVAYRWESQTDKVCCLRSLQCVTSSLVLPTA